MDPDQIREEIVRTRRELGVTVEALVARADMKARARERLDDMRRRATTGPVGRTVVGLVAGAGTVLLVRVLARRFAWSMPAWSPRWRS